MASEKEIEHASEVDRFYEMHAKCAEYQQRKVGTGLGTLLAHKVFQAHNLHEHRFNFFPKYIMSDYRLQSQTAFGKLVLITPCKQDMQ